MPEIKSQHQCLNLDDLKRAESFGEPIGELPMQTDSGFLDRDDIFAGTWECEPGVLELDLDVTEFCHILKGHWVLTCLLYTSPSPRDRTRSRMPSSA